MLYNFICHLKRWMKWKDQSHFLLKFNTPILLWMISGLYIWVCYDDDELDNDVS